MSKESKESLVSTLKSQILEKATGTVEMTRRACYVEGGIYTGGPTQAKKLAAIATEQWGDFRSLLDRLCELVSQ